MASMEWKDVAVFLFGFMFVGISGWIAKSINSMKDSVNNLNVNLAVLMTEQKNDRRKIAEVEDKLNGCRNLRLGTTQLLHREDIQ